MPCRVQRAERLGTQRAKLRLVDDMETDQRVGRAVVERHLKAEWFEQFIGEQRIIKAAARAIAFVEVADPLGNLVKIWRRHAIPVANPATRHPTGPARAAPED